MFKVLVLVLGAVILTFVWGITSNYFNQKRSKPFIFRLNGFHFHHSVIGLILFLVGLLTLRTYLLSIGLGIVIGHGIEEIYFGCRNWRAFFHFITR